MVYDLTWGSSKSGPNYLLARPHNINDTRVDKGSAWVLDWAMNVASRGLTLAWTAKEYQLWFDPQFFEVAIICTSFSFLIISQDESVIATLRFVASSYCWVCRPAGLHSRSSTLLIPSKHSPKFSHSHPVSRTSSTEPMPTTITSAIVDPPETILTTRIVGPTNTLSTPTSIDLVTSSDSTTSTASAQWTTSVTNDGGQGIPLGIIYTIAGTCLAAVFLITTPIVVWLIFRYRCRPRQISNSNNGSNKFLPPSDAESLPTRSSLDLMEPKTPISGSVVNGPSVSTEGTRQIWTIIDGEKRQMTVSRYPSQPIPAADNQDPFADPGCHTPHSAQFNNSVSSPSTIPNDPLPPRKNTTTSRITPSLSNPLHRPSAQTQAELISSTARLIEKAYRPRRQRPEVRPLSSEETATRILTPGRAVDIGPLRRNRIEDVNECGFLPPDYSQAT